MLRAGRKKGCGLRGRGVADQGHSWILGVIKVRLRSNPLTWSKAVKSG